MDKDITITGAKNGYAVIINKDFPNEEMFVFKEFSDVIEFLKDYKF